MKNHLRDLRIIYFALISSTIFMLAVAIFAGEQQQTETNDDLISVFKYLVPVFGILFTFMGFIIFNLALKKIRPEKNFNEKMLKYKAIIIIRLALFEGCIIFPIISLIIANHYIFIIYTLIFLLPFAFAYPRFESVCKELELNPDERMKLQTGMN